MLNLAIGRAVDVEGRSCISTGPKAKGHAVYGPYEAHDPGEYAVQFTMEPLADAGALKPDTLCAVIDVTSNGGNDLHASQRIVAADFAGGRTRFLLPFSTQRRTALEFRVWVSGRLPLLIDDHRQLISRVDGADEQTLLERARFPSDEGARLPFFAERHDLFRSFYERGCLVRIEGDAIVLTVRGISFFVRNDDDLNFVGEVFFDNIYNFQHDRPVCAIDIGMNIGFSSLQFATKEEVREVHSFEPFRGTYDRALANIFLNGSVGRKISHHNFGLADRNWSGEVLAAQTGNSGAMSTVDAGQGTPIQVSVRDAGEVLAPIIESARERGLDVIVKMDCEGSEYAICESLIRNDLLRHITAFMVEWHAIFGDKSQADLTRPLREAGFLIFDRSPPSGNGFFYAANLGSAPRAS